MLSDRRTQTVVKSCNLKVSSSYQVKQHYTPHLAITLEPHWPFVLISIPVCIPCSHLVMNLTKVSLTYNEILCDYLVYFISEFANYIPNPSPFFTPKLTGSGCSFTETMYDLSNHEQQTTPIHFKVTTWVILDVGDEEALGPASSDSFSYLLPPLQQSSLTERYGIRVVLLFCINHALPLPDYQHTIRM